MAYVNSPFAKVEKPLRERNHEPLPLAGKRCLIDGWTQPVDRDKAMAWIEQKKFITPNVGVKTGRLVAIDIDTLDEEMADAIRSVLPPTMVGKTGAKGETLFYRGDNIPNSSWDDSDGERALDLLSHGRQTVIPPSVHPENRWTRKLTLMDVDVRALPEVTTNHIEQLDKVLAPLGVTRGSKQASANTSTEYKGGGERDEDSHWYPLKEAARRDLHAWIDPLIQDGSLYKAQWLQSGSSVVRCVPTWRESGSGQPQERRKQNLKIARGTHVITDFGRNEEHLSPTDLVMKASGGDFDQACAYLRDCLGIDGDGVVIDVEPKPEPAGKVMFEQISDIVEFRGVDRGAYAELEIKWLGKDPLKVSWNAKAVLVPGKTYVMSPIPERSTIKLEWFSPIMEYLPKRRLGYAPTFPLDILPPYLRDFCNHYSQSMSAPLDYFPSALFGCVAGVVGNSHNIIVAPESDYTLAIVLWVMLVGEPSQKKSPALGVFVKHLERSQNAIIAQNKPILEEHQKKVRAFERKHKIWESLCDKVDKTVMEAEMNNPELPAPSNNKPKEPEPDYGAPPYVRRIFIKDATVEKIATLSYQHRLGLLAAYDELLTWLGGMNKYANKGAQSDRAFWNQAYDGKS